MNDARISDIINDTKVFLDDTKNISSKDAYYVGALLYTAVKKAITISYQVSLNLLCEIICINFTNSRQWITHWIL